MGWAFQKEVRGGTLRSLNRNSPRMKGRKRREPRDAPALVWKPLPVAHSGQQVGITAWSCRAQEREWGAQGC